MPCSSTKWILPATNAPGADPAARLVRPRSTSRSWKGYQIGVLVTKHITPVMKMRGMLILERVF